MSDFITELRHEVVAAHARERRRTARSPSPRRWRPTPVIAAAAVAASLLAVVLAVRQLAPAPPPSRPQVVSVLPIGGRPTAAVYAYGSLWVSDFTGRVLRVDVARRRVLARIDLGIQPDTIAAGGGGVWAGDGSHTVAKGLLEIDPAANRVTARVRGGTGRGIAVGAGAVWVLPDSVEGIQRVDPRRDVVTGEVDVPLADAVAVQAGSLWAVTRTGDVVQVDPATGGVVRRQRLPGPVVETFHAWASDGDELLLIDTGRQAVFRFAGGRIVQRIAVDPFVEPLLTSARDGLWTASADGVVARRYRAVRRDPEDGQVTATIELGRRRPVALVPSGDTLNIVTEDGNVLVTKLGRRTN